MSLYFVSKRLDSRDRNFRQLLIMNGMVDEQYLVALSDAVHRGQEGRVMKGFIPGGRCYGYRNVPVEDPSRSGLYGRPAIIGVRQEINEVEAEVVRRMFELYASGEYSLARIARTFSAEHIPPPKPRKGVTPGWTHNGIRDMLRNERYIGRVIWNRSYKIKNPETGIKQDKPRPKEEWLYVDNPSLRIVSDELWLRTQDHIKRIEEKYGWRRLGGSTRAKHAESYIFSGLLKCGVCGRHLVILAGSGRNAAYGWPGDKNKGVCPNSLTIRDLRLEAQLFKGLIGQLLRPEMLEYAITSFHQQLKDAVIRTEQENRRAASEIPKLKLELRRLETEAGNLADAIQAMGHRGSPSLLSHLGYGVCRITD